MTTPGKIEAGVNFSIDGGEIGDVPPYVPPTEPDFHPEAGDNYSVEGSTVEPLE